MENRSRLQKMLDEADAKAAELGEDEINARLGPASRRFFALAERIEDKVAPYFAGWWHKIVMVTLALILGWILGRFLTPFLHLTPVLVLAGFLLSLQGAKTGLNARFKNTTGLLYAFWIIVAVTASFNEAAHASYMPIYAAGLVGFSSAWVLSLFTKNPFDTVDAQIDDTLE